MCYTHLGRDAAKHRQRAGTADEQNFPKKEDDTINTRRKYKSLWLLLWLLPILALLLAGCAGKPGKDNDDQPVSNKEELVEDGQLYILLNCNSDTKRLFLESVETGKQEIFDFDDETKAVDRNREEASVESIPVGELVEIVYTEEQLLTEVAVSEDTFEYRNVTEYEIDPEQASVVVDGDSYSYNEYLKIFSNKGVIPMKVLLEQEDGDTVCLRGRGTEVLTIVLDRKETEGSEFLKWFQLEEEPE